MELVSNVEKTDDELSGKNKFAQMLVGAVVGFVASGLAEKLYEGVVKYRQGKITAEIEK